jgi:hypothetical protein
MINHFPVILSVVSAGAAILGLIARRRIVWTFAAICLTVAGVAVGPVFLSGKEAADVIEDLPHPPRKVIDAHEESSEVALFVVLGAGVVGAIAWWQLARRADTEEPRSWIRAAVTVAALAAAGATGYTALLGGMIYHGAAGKARPAAWDSVSATPPSRPPDHQ